MSIYFCLHSLSVLYFLFYHTSQRKSANPHISEAEIRACLSFLVEKWHWIDYQKGFRLIFFGPTNEFIASALNCTKKWKAANLHIGGAGISKYKSIYYVLLDKLLMTNDWLSELSIHFLQSGELDLQICSSFKHF